MARVRWWAWLALSMIAAASATASCNLILGDRQIYGEDRTCSDDEDCDADERCDDYGGYCHEACKSEATEPQCLQMGASGVPEEDLRECTSDNWCTEPVGTPCDSDGDGDEFCGDYPARCLGEDDNQDEVWGYCSESCSETDPSPPGYVCVSGEWRCTGSSCNEKDE